jgi:2-polyprenyl-6-hydroxyphenyl methylase/3-demethylubiquinone-9 3-methyltransferase
LRYGAKDIDAIDLGCGVGNFTVAAAQACRSAIGVDASAEMVAAARRLAARVSNADFRQQDILAVDEPPVGLVLCSSVLEYVPDLDGALRVLDRLVAPGGHLIVSMPNPRVPYRRLERIVFRATGRPAYLAHVKHMIGVAQLVDRLPRLRLVESVSYSNGRGLYAAVFARPAH